MMKKLTLAVLYFIFGTSILFAQELLDTEKLRDAELFVVKKGYDVQERVKEIKSFV